MEQQEKSMTEELLEKGRITDEELEAYQREIRDGTRCGCCGRKRWRRNTGPLPMVHECRHCGAWIGTAYLGEYYGLVRRGLHAGKATRYFDIFTLGGDGKRERVHGWLNEANQIVQVG